MTEQEIRAICRDPVLFKQHFKSKLAAHQPQTYKYKDVPGVPAAVLFPFYFKDGQAHLLFTRRTELVEHHKGQISLPGGRKDKEDADLLTTALREAREEIGLEQTDVEILGQSDTMLTNTHYCVTPFVGFFRYPYPFNISQAEIAYLIEVPLLHLLDQRNYEIKEVSSDGVRWLLHYYYFGKEVIWGVTGFLLSDLFSIVFDFKRNQLIASGEAKAHVR